jgi:hypothetical protein
MGMGDARPNGVPGPPGWWERLELRAAGSPAGAPGGSVDAEGAERTLGELIERIRPLIEGSRVDAAHRAELFREPVPRPPADLPLPWAPGSAAGAGGGRRITHGGLVIDLDRVLPD